MKWLVMLAASIGFYFCLKHFVPTSGHSAFEAGGHHILWSYIITGLFAGIVFKITK